MARSFPNFKKFVESITIDNAGQNYSSIPGDTALFIGAPTGQSQIQAAATVEINGGQVVNITITEPGDGYTSAPEVYIRSGLFVATNDGLTNTTVANTNRNAATYTNVAFRSAKVGSGAVGNVTIDATGQVSSYEITTSGTLYMEGESVSVLDTDIGGDGSIPDLTFTVLKLKGGGQNADFTAITNIIAETVGYHHEGMNYITEYQIPDFVNDEYPNFATFIKDYYKFMDASSETYEDLGLIEDADTSENNKYSPNYLLQELNDKLNIDHNDDDLLQAFLESYALDFPKFSEVDSRLLVKRIRDFFEAKGSRKGVETFFQMVYNEAAEVVLPSEFVLIPSNNVWSKEVTIKVNANDEISPAGNPFDLRSKRVDIAYYESVGSITVRKIFNVGVTRVKQIAYTNPSSFELTVDLPVDTNVPGPGVEAEATAVIGGKIATVGTIGAADALRASGSYDINTGFTTSGNGTGAQFTVVVNGSGAATITVDVVGDNYAPDETITIPDSLLGGGGAAALTFKVATITDGKIFSVTIVDGGAGYSANPAIIVTPDSADTISTTAVLTSRITNNSVSNILFVNNVQGVGYNNVPTITFNTDSVRSYVALEGLTDSLANKNSFLVRVLNQVAFKTNSGTSDGGFRVGETFSVSETGDILGVYAIDYFGEDYTITGINNNALIRIKTLDTNNYPAVIDIVATGTGFQRENFDFILRSVTDETATLTFTTGFSHTYPGSFKDSRGFLSDANKLQDNAVYQSFSYQIKTSRPKTEWGDLLDRIAHPAGMIAWTDIQIHNTLDMGDSFSATPDAIVYRLFGEIENPAATDAAVFFVTKVLTDSVDWADPHSLQPNLIKTELYSAIDAVNKFDVTLAKTESPDVNDAPSLTPHKPAITDSVSWSETVDTLKLFTRDPSESVDWAETVILGPNLGKNDSIDMSETVTRESENVYTDSVDFAEGVGPFNVETIRTEDTTVNESDVLLFGNTSTETATWGESGQIIAQNYAGDYFAEDYVGEARNIS
jgi:hypothetical protein